MDERYDRLLKLNQKKQSINWTILFFIEGFSEVFDNGS